MASFHEVLTSFVWYTVEFLANLSVIYYVALKAGFIGGPKIVKQDVPATLHDTIKGTAGFMTSLTETVKAARSLVSTATSDPSAVQTTAATPLPPTPTTVRPGGRK